jgi:hypothetical protein
VTTGLLVPPRRASIHQAWPRLAVCSCGEEILLARHRGAGRPYRLDPVEVLPLCVCRACAGNGVVIGELRHVTTGRGSTGDAKAATYAMGFVPCGHCDGTGRRGAHLSDDLVLVSSHDGVARPFVGDRSGWEAAHRRHQCAYAAAA